MSRRLRDYLLLFVIVCVLFLIYIFGRSIITPFIGADSYYFLNHIFYNKTLFTTNFVGTFIFNLLPKNILLIKIIMLLVTLLTLYISYEIARLLSKDNALIYPFSLIAMFSFSLVFFKLEDDLFSLPFLFISLFFIVKYQISTNKKKWLDKNILFSLFFLFISTIIWKYTVLFILMYLFITNFHRLYILASTVFVVFFKEFITTILPNSNIAENQTAFLSFNIAGGIIFLLFFLYLNKSMIKRNKYGIYLFSILTLINFKIIYILLPILFINNIYLLKNKLNKNKIMLYFIYFLFLIGTCYQIINLPPNKEDYALVSIGQSYSKQLNKDIVYPWGLGYFLIYHNINTPYYGTYNNSTNYKNKIVMTVKNKPQFLKCGLLKTGKYYELVNCP